MEHAWLYSELPQDLKETTFDSSGDSAEGIFVTASAVAHNADQVYIYIKSTLFSCESLTGRTKITDEYPAYIKVYSIKL